MNEIVPFEQLNNQIRNQSLIIKKYVVDNKQLICLCSNNSIITYNFITKETVIHTPPPLLKSSPIISIDIYDDLLLTVSNDFTVLVIDLQSYKVFYRQVITGAMEAKFLSSRIFTLYSNDKTLRVIEYPDPSILGFGQRGHVDVLSNSCLTHVTSHTKEIGQFMLATSKSVFLWLCDLNDEKMNRPESKYESCIPPFSCPPTEYYLYKKLQSVNACPLLHFQYIDSLPHIAVFCNGIISFYEEKFIDGTFTVDLIKEYTTETPKSIICCESFVLAQYSETIKIIYGKGEKEIINNCVIENCQNNGKEIVLFNLNNFNSISMPSEDDLMDESQDPIEQIKLCIESKTSPKMKIKGIKLICKIASEGEECWEYAKELECIDSLVSSISKDKKDSMFSKIEGEYLLNGKKLQLSKKNVWDFFVYSLNKPNTILSDLILAYYSDLLDIPSVISICIEYSKYSTIFSLYKSLGKKTIDAFIIVSHNILNHGITTSSLVDDNQKKNIHMLITIAQRCNAEGDDNQIVKPLFNKTNGLSLFEAGLVVCKDQTLDVMRDIQQKNVVIEGLVQTLKSSITEVKECVSKEIIKMKISERGMKEALFIVLTSKDYSKEDGELCVEAIKSCVHERSGVEIDKIIKAAFTVNNKKLLRILIECETARDALLTMLIIQKGDIWSEIESWLRSGLQRDVVEKTVKKFTKKMYEIDIRKTFTIGVKYFPSCALYCLIQPTTPFGIIYEYGMILMNDPSIIIQSNITTIVLRVIESCYETKRETEEIRRILEEKKCEYDKVIILATKFNDERTILMIQRKNGQFEECFKSIRARINDCLNKLNDKSIDENQQNRLIISNNFKGILVDLKEVCESYKGTEELNRIESIIVIMKNCNELVNNNEEYLNNYYEEYRTIVQIICEKSTIKESLTFCQEITEGILFKWLLRDLVKRSKSELSLFKSLQIIANDQMKQSKQCHINELKKGIISHYECEVCKKEKDDLNMVFGCGHFYHSSCLKSSGICLVCNGLMK